jgi:Fur family transcriptional regulator, peroxide stress response regulator
MAIPENRLNKMIGRLKEEGCRLTPQRMAVVKILASNEEHLSAEKIYERVRVDFPFTSLATIYKTVTLLKRLGEVMELGFVDDSNRFDGARPYPHPHLICTICRKILDPDLPVLIGLPKELAKKTGYKILDHRLDFFGVCPACQKREKN